MKLGIVSDIHANLPAFLVVLLTFKREGVSHILNLGDTLGYYNKPREVLAIIRELREAIISRIINRTPFFPAWSRV